MTTTQDEEGKASLNCGRFPGFDEAKTRRAELPSPIGAAARGEGSHVVSLSPLSQKPVVPGVGGSTNQELPPPGPAGFRRNVVPAGRYGYSTDTQTWWSSRTVPKKIW